MIPLKQTNEKCEVYRPNEKWCTDITEIIQKPFTIHHRLYLSAIIDLYDNSIVYYEFSSSLTTDLVLRTLEGALAANPGSRLLIHTDHANTLVMFSNIWLKIII